MLKKKKYAYCYLVDDELYIIGKNQNINWPVVKLCDKYSEKLYGELHQSFSCLREGYSIESKEAFLSCYNRLNSYNRRQLSHNDILLLDFIVSIEERKIQNMIDQVEDYQQMYSFHIHHRGI